MRDKFEEWEDSLCEIVEAFNEIVEAFSDFAEDIQEILESVAEWHYILSAWKSKRGNIELPKYFVCGISYASELSLHPE